MRTAHALAVALVASLAASTAASASTPVQSQSSGGGELSGRNVLICERDAASRRAFIREYGATPVFITAREASALRRSDPSWSAPRCMTEIEHAKLRDATANARVR